jgi:hypothetical protein
VLDLSGLDGDGGVDSGVTSGGDAASWDPINVDKQGHVDSCADDANAHPADAAAPAVCIKPKS